MTTATNQDKAASADGNATEAEAENEPGHATDTDTDTDTDHASEAEAPLDDTADSDSDDADDADDAELSAVVGDKPRTGVGQGAAAIVSVGLAVVAMTGSWVGTVAAARSTLIGQLETQQSASVAQQIQAMYGDSWQLTALIGGAFALAALVVGAVVLARPAFGTSGRVQAPWVTSVAWAGVVLGVLGLLLAIAKYAGLILGLPSA
ncbi:hypothetical protein [Streptomyces apocyni]|uniref:hypothetical protein n=1 Tax=Streptomyces apocyni TaxID=2654677 RepID=UPI0012E9AA1A|nr:hypothetical protein [Streptomyces apocyni]